MFTVRVLVTACLGLVLGAVPAAQGEVLVVHAGSQARLDTPVAVPWAGTGTPKVTDAATGAQLPATARDGELVVVVPELAAGAALRLDVAPDASGDAPGVQVSQREGEQVVEVAIGGEPFTAYHFKDDEHKPYLHPVLSEGGVPVTRAWPMGEAVEGFRQDHVHQRALYTAYGDLNGTDLWSEGERAGFMVTKSVDFGSGDAYGWIRAENVWQTNARAPIVDETREYRFYATSPARRLIDVEITFAANHGEVTFGDTKEGGLLSVRMRPEMSFGSGTITNALGDVGERDLWGKPSPWCDYSAPLEGVGWRGVTIFDHPSNLRHPTSWHVREYGLMGANCFAWSDFVARDYNKPLLPAENGDFVLKAGEQVTFRYRVYVHTGGVEEAGVAARYADFAQPPAVVGR